MSTKVYEGMRFCVRTLPDLVRRMSQAFEGLDQLSRAHEAQFMARYASEQHDQLWLSHRAEPETHPAPRAYSSHVFDAWQEMRKRQREIKATSYRDPEVDSEIEVQVWLGPRGKLYGYVHSEVSGVRDLLMTEGLAEDFAYWNNTDRDPAVSSARWKRRGVVWDRLFDGEFGKSFSFKGSNLDMPAAELVRAAIPSRNTRARLLAEEVIYPVWIAENGIEVTAGNAGRTVLRFERQCKREAGPWKDRFEQEVQELEASLPELALGSSNEGEES